MIKRISVTNWRGETLDLELANPEASGFAVKSVSGLGPAEATINTTSNTSNDGALYNSSRIGTRNIVLNLYLLWNSTIEESRLKLYKYFPVKKQLKFEVETDNRTAYIYGYVESNDVTIFTKTETAQVSILCPNPFFISSNRSGNYVFGGISDAFEFPFANEDTEENLLEMSTINLVNSVCDTYYGDADVGVKISIRINGSVGNIRIYNETNGGYMKLNADKIASLVGSAMALGDLIEISTVRGSKYVRLLRGGVYTNILNALDKNSEWIQLSYGDNVISYSADSGVMNIQFVMENQVLYEGV